MALQPTISTTESIRRLMQPSWPLAHETIRQHTERQCHCGQAEHMVAPTNPLANSDPSTHRRSKPINAVDQCTLLTQSGHARPKFHSGARACRRGSLEIIIRPENGRLSSKIRKIAHDADSAKRDRQVKTVTFKSENRLKLANMMTIQRT